MAELHDLTALEQGAAIRTEEVSPAELVEHYLARIERLSDTVGAFVTVTGRDGRAVRRTPRGERAARRRPDRGQGPEHDRRRGHRARLRHDEGYVPDVSDEVVLRLEAAGLVSLGKTSTPEFGSPCYTEPDNAPPARTPWDLERMAGGSSGGAAAAVAAGLVPVAQGSDGGGSIRIPASCCGLFGLKPSRGRVSGGPMYGDPVGLGTAGPLARTVRDAAALLDVLAGPAVGDPYWAPPPPTSFLAACDVEPGRLRIARFRTPVIADADAAPGGRRRLRGRDPAARLARPRRRGDRRPGAAGGGGDVRDLLVGAHRAVAAPARDRAPAPPVDPRGSRSAAGRCPARSSAWPWGRRGGSRRGRCGPLAPYDAVLTPTLAQPPLRIGEIRDDADPARDFENQKAFTPWTSAWNLTGMPAVSLPLHMTDGRAAGRCDAGRPPRRGARAARALRAARGRRARGPTGSRRAGSRTGPPAFAPLGLAARSSEIGSRHGGHGPPARGRPGR